MKKLGSRSLLGGYAAADRGFVLEQLEERIVLDGAVTDVHDLHDQSAGSEQVDSLGWVYVDNGWWVEDNGSGWWWQESSDWFWNENTGWWAQNANGYTLWSHGDHQFWAQESATGDWLWFDDITDQNWEPAFTWYAGQLNSEWTWVYNDWNGTYYNADDLHYFYQDHYNGAEWWWFDAVNDAAWEHAQTWFVDSNGAHVFNDWDSSEYIWGNDFQYTQQHTSSYVNDAPVIIIPGDQTVNENSNLNIPGIYVFDVDSGTSQLEVSLSVSHGDLTLTDSSGLEFQDGSDGLHDSLMTFTGSWSQINNALQTAVFTPLNDAVSTFTVTVNDLGNSGIGGELTAYDSFSITIHNVDPLAVGTITDMTTNEGEGTTAIDLTTYFSDVPADMLSYGYSDDGGTTWNAILDPTDFSLIYGNEGVHAIQVRASDGGGGAAAVQSFQLTVNNVAAVFGGNLSGTMTEDDATVDGVATVTDPGEGESFFQTATGLIGTDGHGTLDIAADGQWTYTLTDAAAQALRAGESMTDDVTVHSADGTPQVIHIEITGVNDAATFSGDTTGGLVEDGVGTTDGTLSVTDTDTGEATIVSGSTEGDYGTFEIDAAGAWTYTVSLDAGVQASIQALGAGETLTDTFSVTSADGTAQNVVITITGVNDAAAFSGNTTGEVFVLVGEPDVFGNLEINDLDNGESFVVAQTETEGEYGTFTIDPLGMWVYHLDSDNPALLEMDELDIFTDTFTVHSVDGNVQNIVITIRLHEII